MIHRLHLHSQNREAGTSAVDASFALSKTINNARSIAVKHCVLANECHNIMQGQNALQVSVSFDTITVTEPSTFQVQVKAVSSYPSDPAWNSIVFGYSLLTQQATLPAGTYTPAQYVSAWNVAVSAVKRTGTLYNNISVILSYDAVTNSMSLTCSGLSRFLFFEYVDGEQPNGPDGNPLPFYNLGIDINDNVQRDGYGPGTFAGDSKLYTRLGFVHNLNTPSLDNVNTTLIRPVSHPSDSSDGGPTANPFSQTQVVPDYSESSTIQIPPTFYTLAALTTSIDTMFQVYDSGTYVTLNGTQLDWTLPDNVTITGGTAGPYVGINTVSRGSFSSSPYLGAPHSIGFVCPQFDHVQSVMGGGDNGQRPFYILPLGNGYGQHEVHTPEQLFKIRSSSTVLDQIRIRLIDPASGVAVNVLHWSMELEIETSVY